MSSDPNSTSRRASSSVGSSRFPLNEQLDNFTMLRFVEYSRTTPADEIQSRTTNTISLPLPVQVPEVNQIKSNSYDAGIIGNLESFTDTVSGTSVSDLVQRAQGEYASLSAKDIATGIALAPGRFGDDRVTAAQVTAGVIKNPHTVAFFDGVQLRVYNLTWRFSARSEQEANEINRIVGTIRERMHPAESFSGYALDYPDLVFVEFQGPTAEYLPKYYRSFISSMSFQSSSGDGMVLYWNGAPVSVELSLTFNETNIVTRDVIQNG
jgi:hypothetical protein